jgi:uncharacterized damage-inducible protein DinB
MDKAAVGQMWDQIRQRYGIYLHLLELIPEERYHDHVVPDMRTPAELVTHVSGVCVRDVAVGVAKGEITADESVETEIAAGLPTKADVIAYARSCWDEASAATAGLGEAEINAMVPTPWGMTFPGWVGLHLMRDELLHHRGQLYVYARVCGIAPPHIWHFDENEPAFRPSE